MQVQNTKDYQDVASVVICVYGVGGVGKSTFASTFPKPLLFDFENGAKFFKQRGIAIDVVRMDDWFTIDEKKALPKLIENYDTIILDPIGEAMEKLIKSDLINGSKYRMTDGSLTMAGWGKVKDEFRGLIKYLRDQNKHLVLVAHVDEKQDEQTIIKRPLIATKISDEIIAMVDIVGYLELVTIEGTEKRILRVSPTEKYIAKDRTGTLDKLVKPDFNYIIEQIKSRQATVVTSDEAKEAIEAEMNEEEPTVQIDEEDGGLNEGAMQHEEEEHVDDKPAPKKVTKTRTTQAIDPAEEVGPEGNPFAGKKK